MKYQIGQAESVLSVSGFHETESVTGNGEGDDRIYAAVRSSDREGRLQFSDAPRAPALGTLPHRIVGYTDAASLLKRIRRERTGIDRQIIIDSFCFCSARAFEPAPTELYE